MKGRAKAKPTMERSWAVNMTESVVFHSLSLAGSATASSFSCTSTAQPFQSLLQNAAIDLRRIHAKRFGHLKGVVAAFDNLQRPWRFEMRQHPPEQLQITELVPGAGEEPHWNLDTIEVLVSQS